MENSDLCQCRIIHHDRVRQAQEKALDQSHIVDMAMLFKTMGDPTRMKILWALKQKEMCVCDLAAFLRLTESAVSHQLRTLRQLHLVANRREGPVLYYRLNDQHVNELIKVALVHVREAK